MQNSTESSSSSLSSSYSLSSNKHSSKIKSSIFSSLILTSGISATQFTSSSPTTLYSSWVTSAGLQATNHDIGTNVPLFGTGTIDELYINNYGGLSYNDIDSADTIPAQVADNILIAPFFLPSVGGSVSTKKRKIFVLVPSGSLV